jgi:hypothetical protein
MKIKIFSIVIPLVLIAGALIAATLPVSAGFDPVTTVSVTATSTVYEVTTFTTTMKSGTATYLQFTTVTDTQLATVTETQSTTSVVTSTVTATTSVKVIATVPQVINNTTTITQIVAHEVTNWEEILLFIITGLLAGALVAVIFIKM